MIKLLVIIKVLVLVSLILCGCQFTEQSQLQFQTPLANNTSTLALERETIDLEEWQPAIFKGIRVGKDTRDLAMKKFGKPTWSGEPEGQDKKNPEIWDNYENIDEFHKKITVMSTLKDGTILQIESYPPNITVEEAIKIFGDNYKKTTYSLIQCDKTIWILKFLKIRKVI